MAETVDDIYLYYTQRAGEVSRQLCLAAVGAIWVLQSSGSNSGSVGLRPLPHDLKVCLVFTVLSLTVDLLQYIVGIFVWYSVFASTPPGELKNHLGRAKVMLIFVATKLALLIAGYAYLAHYAYLALF
jgi:hypothetical protein